MVLAADYPFLDVFWTMILFFCWIAWFWMLILIVGDLFRRDISGWAKAAWCVFLIVLPFLGVFIYLVTQGDGLAERSNKRLRAQAQRVLDTAEPAGSADEIAKAKQLLDSGAISQAEFDSLKQKALG